VNLLIGVIFYEFRKETQKSKHKFLDQSQIWWIKLQKKIISTKPDFLYYKPPDTRFRRYLFHKFNSSFFKMMINCAIIMDIVLLAIYSETATSSFIEKLEQIHMALNLFFLMETGVKMFTYGKTNYFHHLSHRVEFFISITIIIDLGMFFYYDTIFFSIKYISKIIKAMRVVKMIRLLSIIYKIRVVKKLLQTLQFSIPMIVNISSLLFLTYYIYVLFGCHYFQNITTGQIIDEYINFKNFSYALLTMLKISTADGWEVIMYDIMSHYSKLYIFSIFH